MADPAPSFFWHDYETGGTDPRRHRPMQFAGQRTDLELRPVGEAVSLFCQPADDVLPEPEACVLTGITPQHAARHGMPEHAFAAAVHAHLSRPGTIGAGYNSLRFDDEFTRFLFWRCLIEPYGREWRDGNARWDLLDALRTAHALRPEGIEWPRRDDGFTSFRLGDLTAANGLAHEAAHDAGSDVQATIALARRLREAQPRLWDFCLKLCRKEAVWEQVGRGRPVLHVSGRYPAARGHLAIVWPLAPHPGNRNELIVWDLAEDPGVLATLDAEAVRARLFTAAAGLPEGTARLPIKTLRVNRSPIVIGELKTLTPAARERWGIDFAAVMRHAERAAALPASVAALWPAVYARPSGGEAPDVDEDLYGGFVSDADRRRLEQWRALPPTMLGAASPRFEDERLAELSFRYRARNFPETLAADERWRWHRHRVARLHEGAGGALTLAAFLERIDMLAEQAAERGDERAEAILEALVDYAGGIAPER
jgi:exodeoxyribonuclease-1